MDTAAAKKRCEKYLTDEERRWYEDAGFADDGDRVGSVGRTADRMPIVLGRLAETREALEEAQGKLEEIGREAQDWADAERGWYCCSRVDGILRGSKEDE